MSSLMNMNQKYLRVVLLAGIMVSASLFLNYFQERDSKERPEKKWSGRTFEAETEVERVPLLSPEAHGFDTERVWSGQDDWEPAIAVDPQSSYVYQLTTRFSGPRPCGACPLPAIAFHSSSNGGATWNPDKFPFLTGHRQADPEIALSANGTIFAACLTNGGIEFTKSSNRGKTWSQPVDLKNTVFADKPILTVSADGKDIYIGFNAGDGFVYASHNSGVTFTNAIRTSHSNRTWFHTGGLVAPDRAVYFATTDYKDGFVGDSHVRILKSTDLGRTWITKLVDTSKEQPDCQSVPGCYLGFIGTSVAMAMDENGLLMIAYHVNDVTGTPERMYIRTSRDGVHWTARKRISVASLAVNNAFPAVASGTGPNDFRVAWQDDRNGAMHEWNTWFRKTTDGGATWSKAIRLSNRTSGAPYKNTAGYSFPYGDYMEIAVSSSGMNFLIWGEAASYDGPGGSWYTRGG
jgi:hypothetical protein